MIYCTEWWKRQECDGYLYFSISLSRFVYHLEILLLYEKHAFFSFASVLLIKDMFNFLQLLILYLFSLWIKVGGAINTSMSICDGLGPCIICRKLETTRPMREHMDEKVVNSPPKSAFQIWYTGAVKTFPYLYLDLACKQLCFPWRKRYEYVKWKCKNTTVVQ